MARASMSRSRSAMVAATGLSALAGLAQAASLALPGTGQPVWWLQWLSMLVLAGLLHHLRPSGRQGGWLGFVFALAWLCGTFWWLFISLHIYGGLAAPLAVMRDDHHNAANLLRGIEHASHGLTLPEGACGSWTALYTGLRKLGDDLVAHMHLEETVLFPRFEAQ